MGLIIQSRAWRRRFTTGLTWALILLSWAWLFLNYFSGSTLIRDDGERQGLYLSVLDIPPNRGSHEDEYIDISNESNDSSLQKNRQREHISEEDLEDSEHHKQEGARRITSEEDKYLDDGFAGENNEEGEPITKEKEALSHEGTEKKQDSPDETVNATFVNGKTTAKDATRTSRNSSHEDTKTIQLSHNRTGFKHSDNNCSNSPVQLVRKGRVEMVCEKISKKAKSIAELAAKGKHFRTFLVDEERKILYCFTPKVACTTWKGLLIGTSAKFREQNPFPTSIDFSKILTDRRHISRHLEKYGLKPLSDYGGDEIQNIVDTYFKFMYVRHPFSRIVSAFRDKFGVDRPNFHDGVLILRAKDIVNRYRSQIRNDIIAKGGTAVLENYTLPVSFDDVPKKKATKEKIPNKINVKILKEISPLQWPEFVQYIIDSSEKARNSDIYWESQVKLCHPCQIKYDFIGTFETMQSDNEKDCVISQMTDLPILFPKAPDSRFSSSKTPAGENTESLVKKYFHNLTVGQQESLGQVYKSDCAMFGYEC